MQQFGRQCVVVAIDAKRNYNTEKGKNIFSDDNRQYWFEVFIYGGKKATGLDSIVKEEGRMTGAAVSITGNAVKEPKDKKDEPEKQKEKEKQLALRIKLEEERKKQQVLEQKRKEQEEKERQKQLEQKLAEE